MALTLARRIFKIACFLILTFAVARILGNPEIYINQNLASWLALTLTGDVNAESIYDSFFYIDVTCVITISAITYLLTMKLIRKVRSK